MTVCGLKNAARACCKEGGDADQNHQYFNEGKEKN